MASARTASPPPKHQMRQAGTGRPRRASVPRGGRRGRRRRRRSELRPCPHYAHPRRSRRYPQFGEGRSAVLDHFQWSEGRATPGVQSMDTALITGASRGLGLALARALARRSWRLVIDARGAEALEAARAELGIVHRGRGDPRRRRRPRAPARSRRLPRARASTCSSTTPASSAQPAAATVRLPARRVGTRLPRQRACAARAVPGRPPRAPGGRVRDQRHLRRRRRGARAGAATAVEGRARAAHARLAAEHPELRIVAVTRAT